MNRSTRPLITALAAALLVSAACTARKEALSLEPRKADSDFILKHIQYLASDELEGRFPGSEGDSLSIDHVIREFKKYGLTPYPGKGWKQEFDVTVGISLGDDNSTVLNGSKLETGREAIPYGFSGLGNAEAGIVFGAYGVSLSGGEWDDYRSLDVKGRAVILFTGKPDLNDSLSQAAEEPLQKRVMRAKDRGAAAVIFTSPGDSTLPQLKYDQKLGVSGIPVIYIPVQVLDRLVQIPGGRTLTALNIGMGHAGRSLAMDLPGNRISINIDLKKIQALTCNVVGYLEGTEAGSRDSLIVIGAHRDHLGWGGKGSPSTKPDTVAVHNGADDNASGAAGLLEMARLLSDPTRPLRHSVLFISFGAEEMGTLGSSYYTENPFTDHGKNILMINMDMIGRLREDKLVVFGANSSPVLPDALKGLNRSYNFDLTVNTDGVGASDHGPFYNKGIPSVFFFTGSHGQYHTPEDDWQLINAPGEATVIDFIDDFIRWADARHGTIPYQKVISGPNSGGRGGMKIKLGITPDFTTQVKGVGIQAVHPGLTGEKAGLLPGDVLVAINDKEITGIREYMYRLQELKPGDVLRLKVVRSGEMKELEIILE